ncbi:probable protein phosphatase 2C 25 [Quercus lobata]|uniref:protein-serine/threonine phosphatase n=1 Tax=Quercus lobata TaxID=97700 RepID=A0A7N2KQ07_QUELO|nr:probable protein phosphatase 2C 25 [Quercus lobata]
MSVAVSNSPVFSPSSSLFCNKTSIITASPEALTLTLSHLKPSPCSSSSSAPSSPSSPFRLRFPKPPTGLSSSSSSVSVSTSGSSSPNSVLKRKRPARLDIPVASMCFGAPATPSMAAREVVEEEANGYSVYCKRGRREAMEDRYSALLNLQGDSKQAFFGIFDGHGGAKAAEFAAENLDKNIIDEVMTRGENEIDEAVKQGYLNTDSDFLKEDMRGGSCCVTALIRKGNLVVSNVGDCRAVLSRGGVAEALTSDHRPSRKDEKERIETLGGYVDFCHGVWRIQGSLAVSRGIGDRHLKQWVIAEPDTKVLRIIPEYEFLILASDGLWDKVSNQEAVDIARPLCIDTPQPLAACKMLADLSASRGSSDDISVMLIQLGRYI